MPLVKRRISPVRLARRPSTWGKADDGEEVSFTGEYDLTAVTNVTLCGALRQLASLVTAAQGISQVLEEELGKLTGRTASLTSRLASLHSRVTSHNPRTVTVRKCNLCYNHSKVHALGIYVLLIGQGIRDIIAVTSSSSIKFGHNVYQVLKKLPDCFSVRVSQYFV
ncbi:hypothetical protein Pmani_034629 [Petrolisthes manimaculis]|uniref:Wiskott-Aldrich syndrome protein family member 2 n=1 Tax=Petrolisthes manimaculis TaxID=1843537 RepID=A0AAE1TNY0_9EUCA|nr:hypothetical protein Pmani_034629 [Petrolisthes manimaculis]